MKINITSTSNMYSNTIIEVNSIDDAIKRLQTDKELVLSSIDTKYSDLKDLDYIPNQFYINTNKQEKYDVEIEIYDYYKD